MRNIETRRIDEIRDWRSAFRPFNIVPDNTGPAQIQRDEMVEMIDDLLTFLDPKESSLNDRVVLSISYNNYLLSESMTAQDVATVLRFFDTTQELDFQNTLTKDRPKIEIRLVPRDQIKPLVEVEPLPKHQFQPMEDDEEYCGVDGCHLSANDEIHDWTPPVA